MTGKPSPHGPGEAPPGTLLPGELLVAGEPHQGLRYTAAGPPGRPLVLFLPGGGHLARVAYGTPGAAPGDFLAHWITAAGYPLLAMSYPSDHPAFTGDSRMLTVGQWAGVVARTARAVIDEGSLAAEVIVLAWSMAGRMAVPLNRAARAAGLRIRCFVSLAATPPIPGLAGGGSEPEPLTASGLWDVTRPEPGRRSRAAHWQEELGRQARLEGREIIPWPHYQRWNLCNTPLNLRGEGNRMTPAGLEHDLAGTIDDLGCLAFADYPPLAALIPASRFDARHSLTDSAAWTFLAAQRIAAMTAPPPGRYAACLPEEAWELLRQLAASLPARLTRTIEGGHLFFLGAKGACQTTRLALELADAAAALDQELRGLLPRTGHDEKETSR